MTCLLGRLNDGINGDKFTDNDDLWAYKRH